MIDVSISTRWIKSGDEVDQKVTHDSSNIMDDGGYHVRLGIPERMKVRNCKINEECQGKTSIVQEIRLITGHSMGRLERYPTPVECTKIRTFVSRSGLNRGQRPEHSTISDPRSVACCQDQDFASRSGIRTYRDDQDLNMRLD